MTDSLFNFDEWAASLGLTFKTMSALTAEDFTNVDALKTLGTIELDKLGLTKDRRWILRHAVCQFI